MSQALLELSSRLNEVRLLTYLDPTRGGDFSQPDKSNALTRACILLLSAHLEGFLEDLLTEALDFLIASAANVDDLPLMLRAIHVEEHLRKIESVHDRNARAPRIENMISSESALWSSGNQLQAGMLRPKLVCAEMSNPGSKEISQFLQILGLNIDAYLDNLGNLSFLLQVNGLIGRRNSIAHGDSGTSAAYTDIDRYLAIIGDLSREIDVAVSLQVQTICQMATMPW